MATSGYWTLPTPNFFDKFKPPISKASRDAKNQNIIQICEDVYYYWRSSTKTIIRAHSSDIWESSKIGFETPYEEWTLSSPLPFHATQMFIRKVPKELSLLWGPLGAAVITFPNDKRSERVANCELIGGMNYIMNPRLTILQAKWHPSTTQTLVTILNNDNFLRCYSPDDNAKCLSAIPAGPLDSLPFRYKRTSANFDATVDFDFGPHLSEQNFWPVFLLKSSGVMSYLLMKFIGSTNRAVWEEEKSITIDGDLEDILELPATISVGTTFPLLITIGGLGGSLYHTMLLPFETDRDCQSASIDLENSLASGDVALFVKEVVVLESEDQLTSIRIIPDPICSYRYACLHQNGVHLVTVNFAAQLMKYLSTTGSLSSLESNTEASCVFIISSADNSITAAFSDCAPQKFIGVTEAGETVVYDVGKCGGNSGNAQRDANGYVYESTPKLSQLALNALQSVTSILSRPSNPTHISRQQTVVSPEKQSAAILDVIRVIQKEYIHKQEQALMVLTGTVGILSESTKQLHEPLKQIHQEQPSVRAQTEDLAEKYEELNDSQMKLRKRFQAAMTRHNRSLSVMSDEERKWANKIQEIELDLPQIKEQVAVLKGMAHDWAEVEHLIQRATGKEAGTSPRSKVSAMDLLNIKREVIQHQKILGELTQSIQEIKDNISQ